MPVEVGCGYLLNSINGKLSFSFPKIIGTIVNVHERGLQTIFLAKFLFVFSK